MAHESEPLTEAQATRLKEDTMPVAHEPEETQRHRLLAAAEEATADAMCSIRLHLTYPRPSSVHLLRALTGAITALQELRASLPAYQEKEG